MNCIDIIGIVLLVNRISGVSNVGWGWIAFFVLLGLFIHVLQIASKKDWEQ